MTNYRQILRLHSLGLNKTQIAQSCGCSRTTVIQVIRRAEERCLSHPLPECISDKELSDMLFPQAVSKPEYKMPDYEYIHREMQKSGVTLRIHLYGTIKMLQPVPEHYLKNINIKDNIP